MTTGTCKGHVDAEALSRKWRCGLDTAQRIIERTTQLAVRDFTTTSGTRRLKPYAMQLKYPRVQCDMYLDTLIGKCTLLLGNTFMAIYATDFQWTFAELMKK